MTTGEGKRQPCAMSPSSITNDAPFAHFARYRASDSKWLLSGVVEDILVKVNAITNSKKTRLWLVDQKTETFSLYDASPSASVVMSKQVTAPIGTGIVGHAISVGDIQNSPNPTSDTRYYPIVDTLTDEAPNSILCAPIYSPRDGQVVAALHLCGRKHAHEHTAEDVRLAEMFSNQLTSVVATISPSSSSSSSSSTNAKTSSPSSIPPSSSLAIDSSLTTLCETIESQLATVVKADHHTLYLFDGPTSKLVGASYSLPPSLPLTAGVLGDVASNLSTANVANIHRDPNFNFDVDTQLDKSCQAALVLPITVHDGLRVKSKGSEESGTSSLIGIIQILRSRRGKNENPFSSSDLNAVRDYANSVMPSLNDWQKFRKKKAELVSLNETLRSNAESISSLEEQINIQEANFKSEIKSSFDESNAALASLLSLVSSASSASLSPHNNAFSVTSVASVLPVALPFLIPAISAVRFLPLDHSSGSFQLSEGASFPLSTGITGQCISKHATVQVDDVSEDAYFNITVDSDPSSSSTSSSSSLLLLPLSHNNGILAVVQAFSPSPLPTNIKATVTNLLHTISGLLQMVDNAHAQQHRNTELLDAMSEVKEQVTELSDSIASDIDCLAASKALSTFFSTSPSTTLPDVMGEISNITSSLFSNEFSTIYKLGPPSSLVTYDKGKEIVADVSSPIQGRCLSAKHPIRLTREETEGFGNVALDIKFGRLTSATMLIPINSADSTVWGVLEVSNPSKTKSFTVNDEKKLLKWSHHVCTFLLFHHKYQLNLASLATVTNEKNQMFDAIKTFNVWDLSLTQFLHTAHGHAEIIYDAVRVSVYIADRASNELRYLDHYNGATMCRISASGDSSIPSTVLNDPDFNTKCFSADNDAHKKLMTTNSSLVYFPTNVGISPVSQHRSLFGDNATTVGNYNMDVTVICTPILLESSAIGVLELVLTNLTSSSYPIESVEKYAVTLATPLCRYLDLQRQEMKRVKELEEQERVSGVLLNFSGALSSRDELEMIEDDLEQTIPSLVDVESSSLFLVSENPLKMQASLPSPSTIKLPSAALPAQAYQKKSQSSSNVSHQLKIAVPVMKAEASETEHPVAVLLLTFPKNSAPLTPDQKAVIPSVIALLYSNICRLSQRKVEKLAADAKLEKTTKNVETLKATIVRMTYLNDISEAISKSHSNLSNFFSTICSHTCSFMNADRATLFIVDRDTNELYSLAGGTEIRIPITCGIVGHVVLTKTILNIPDAYRDARFNRDVDTKTGYTTKSILCGAFLDETGEVVGVLQLINKRTGFFTEQDETLLRELFDQTGHFITNRLALIQEAEIEHNHEESERLLIEEKLNKADAENKKRLESEKIRVEKMKREMSATKDLLDLSASFANDLSTTSVFQEAVVIAPRVMSADRATLFLINERNKELYSFIKTSSGNSGMSEIRIPLLTGIAGFVASTSQTLNLRDAYEDSRFNKEVDLRTGYRTKGVLCGPVCDPKGKVIGALQVINKVDGGEFSEADEELLLELTRIIGGAVERAMLHGKDIHTIEERLEKEREILKKAEEDRLQLVRENRLMQLTDKVGGDSELPHLFQNIVDHAPNVMNAERATLFLYNKTNNELMSRNTSNEGEEFRFSAQFGLAGYAATTATVVNVDDAYKDNRFNQNFDVSSGFRTKQVLAAPIFDHNNRSVIGVLQIINCTEGDQFDDKSEALVAKLNRQLEVAIARCLKHKEEVEENAHLLEEEHHHVEDLEKLHEQEHTEIVALQQKVVELGENLREASKREEGKVKELEEKVKMMEVEGTLVKEKARIAEEGYKKKVKDLEDNLEKELAKQAELEAKAKMMSAVIRRDEKLDRVASSLATDLNLVKLFEQVCVHACDIMMADRATLFMVDHEKNELWSMVAHGEEEIRIPKTSGVAGHCAISGEVVNIKDAYSDSRFNRSVDSKTGYVTKTILCSPVFDQSGNRRVVGVMQIINKLDSASGFTPNDEDTLSSLNKKVSDAISRCNRFNKLQVALKKEIADEKGKELELEKRLEAKEKELSEEVAREKELKQELLMERNLQRVAQALADDIEIQGLFDQVCDHACNLMTADRATLFLVDHEKGEIWSQVAHGSAEIRVPLGVGIAGFVATTGKVVNIPDAYKDSRFNPEVDRKSGYRTSTILCSPLFEASGAVVGVLQIINKDGGAFDSRDEDTIRKLGTHTASAITRCQEYSGLNNQLTAEMEKEQKLLADLRREKALMKLGNTIASDLQMQTLFSQACLSACEFMGADRATLFLVDWEKAELWSLVAHGTQEIRVQVGEGISGGVAQSAMMVNIKDAYQDRRFNPEHDRKTGYKTESVLCSPVQGDNGAVVGVLQVINKKIGGGFDIEDESYMSELCETVGSAVRRCIQYSGLQDKLITEQGKEEELRGELEKQRLLQKMGHAIANDLQMQNLFDQVCENACALMKADRATLFLIDRATNEIWSQVAHGSAEIRCPVGVGIAGFVAQSGETVNIVDAYQDSRFNQDFDKKSGYRTRSILCSAVRERPSGEMGEIVGVLQIINKEGGNFTEQDEVLIRSLNETVAGGILRCLEYSSMKEEYEEALAGERGETQQALESMERERGKIGELERRLEEEKEKERVLREKGDMMKTMLDMERSANEDKETMIHNLGELADLSSELARKSNKKGRDELDGLFKKIVSQACTIMKAERASIFFYDRAKNMLWSKVAKGTEGRLQFSADSGIAGEVCKTGRILNIKNPSTDPRFNNSVDKKTGFITTSLLTVPIFGEDGVILGVMQILNKAGGAFDGRDEEKSVLLTKQISNAMAVHVSREQERSGIGVGKPKSPKSISPKSARRRVSYAVDGSPVQMRSHTRSMSPIPGFSMSDSAFGSPALLRSRSSPNPTSPLGLASSPSQSIKGLDVKTLEKLGDFFRQITSDESLSGEVHLCGTVRSLAPFLLNMSSVSLWLHSPSNHTTLWSQASNSAEKYFVNASDGVLGECVLGRRTSKIIKPSWTDLGTMRIPDVSVTSSVGFVLCAPVEVGGEILGAIQCVETSRTVVDGSDMQMAVLLGRALGFAVMLNRVADRVGIFEELSHRMDVANRANLGVGIACGQGSYGEIAREYIEPHLQSLLSRRCSAQMYLSDPHTSVLYVSDGSQEPDMVMGDEGSMVGRSGWLGEVVCYDSNPSYANEAKDDEFGASRDANSSVRSPVKSMLNLSLGGGGEGGSGMGVSNSSFGPGGGRVSPPPYNTSTVCIPLLLPPPPSGSGGGGRSQALGCSNKNGQLVLGVLRVSSQGNAFVDSDVATMRLVAAQLTAAVAAKKRGDEIANEVKEEAVKKHKTDKKIAYGWKKVADGWGDNYKGLGKLVVGLMQNGYDKEGVKDLVIREAKSALNCADVEVVGREEVSAGEGGMLDGERGNEIHEVVIRAMRTGQTVILSQGKDGVGDVLCTPVWDDARGMNWGVLVCGKKGGEFTEGEKQVAEVMAGIVGVSMTGGGGGGRRKGGRGRGRSIGGVKEAAEGSKKRRKGEDEDNVRGGLESVGGENIDEIQEATMALNKANTFDGASHAAATAAKRVVEDVHCFLFIRDGEKQQRLKPLFPSTSNSISTAAGVLGYVATTGNDEVISCAKLHRLFDDAVDCHGRIDPSQPQAVMALRDARRKVVGILQVVGKDRDEGFGESDVGKLERIRLAVEVRQSRGAAGAKPQQHNAYHR